MRTAICGRNAMFDGAPPLVSWAPSPDTRVELAGQPGIVRTVEPILGQRELRLIVQLRREPSRLTRTRSLKGARIYIHAPEWIVSREP